MKKQKAKKRLTEPSPGPVLFTTAGTRRRHALILPRYLTEDSQDNRLLGSRFDRAFEIMKRWADLESQGHLARKETALDASFLHEVFGEALGYRTSTQSPDKYELERNFSVEGAGTADGALGEFSPSVVASPSAVIELKGAHADLDRDKFNGRTPVRQCWDYLDALLQCPWGIVSNFVSIRLYHRNKTPLAYQEFRLQELRKLENFRQFYYLSVRGRRLASIRACPAAAGTATPGENRYSPA